MMVAEAEVEVEEFPFRFLGQPSLAVEARNQEREFSWPSWTCKVEVVKMQDIDHQDMCRVTD